jgi:allophanate hydrolase subunit 1
MAMRNIALYEALKAPVGEEAARMIAEVVPAAEDLSTKLDIAAVHIDIARLEKLIAETRGEIHASTNRTIRWMLTFFIPVWAGTWATVVAVLLKG